jgi:MoaA/NifB/PqqE/SkfB family radical SAM enzyme
LGVIADAVADGVLPGRVWFYGNHHCNLVCAYCLTESGPRSPQRRLTAEKLVRMAEQAAALGFTELGVTGGEPFLVRDLPATLGRLASILPTVVLTNATLFGDRLLAELAPLAALPLSVQISLDAPDPDVNDELRGPENFAKVIDAVPKLVGLGFRVRIATTVPGERLDAEDHERLCKLHRSLGVPDDDHLVRPVVRRGRAEDTGGAIAFTPDDVAPELTITADGAFWSPFGPTVRDGRLATDLLVSRQTDPLERPAHLLLRLVEGRPRGDDARIGIR